jgi:hypothetical protein
MWKLPGEGENEHHYVIGHLRSAEFRYVSHSYVPSLCGIDIDEFVAGADSGQDLTTGHSVEQPVVDPCSIEEHADALSTPLCKLVGIMSPHNLQLEASVREFVKEGLANRELASVRI